MLSIKSNEFPWLVLSVGLRLGLWLTIQKLSIFYCTKHLTNTAYVFRVIVLWYDELSTSVHRLIAWIFFCRISLFYSILHCWLQVILMQQITNHNALHWYTICSEISVDQSITHFSNLYQTYLIKIIPVPFFNQLQFRVCLNLLQTGLFFYSLENHCEAMYFCARAATYFARQTP